jgi:hypothetical protein
MDTTKLRRRDGESDRDHAERVNEYLDGFAAGIYADALKQGAALGPCDRQRSAVGFKAARHDRRAS